MISKGEIIGFQNNLGFRDAVLDDVLRLYSEKGTVEITNNLKKVNKIAISSTTDSEADRIIYTLIKGDASQLKQGTVENIKGKTLIKPLYLFLDKEVLLYTKLKKLKFDKNVKNKKDNISLFIDELEEKYPEVKQSIIGSYLELYK